MWLSKQTKAALPTADADLGVTTVSGSRPGVVTKGEIRALPVFGPGGYCWQPAGGDTVLVIKGGTGGEESCVAGMKQTDAEDLEPGEIRLFSTGGASVCLKNNGTVAITGTVSITGQLLINGTACQSGCGGL